jgi:hypothetical protein
VLAARADALAARVVGFAPLDRFHKAMSDRVVARSSFASTPSTKTCHRDPGLIFGDAGELQVLQLPIFTAGGLIAAALLVKKLYGKDRGIAVQAGGSGKPKQHRSDEDLVFIPTSL